MGEMMNKANDWKVVFGQVSFIFKRMQVSIKIKKNVDCIYSELAITAD